MCKTLRNYLKHYLLMIGLALYEMCDYVRNDVSEEAMDREEYRNIFGRVLS